MVLQHHASGKGLGVRAMPEEFNQQRETVRVTVLTTGHEVLTLFQNPPAGVGFGLPIMCGAIVSPQNVSGVEGLLTVPTGIFLRQLLKRRITGVTKASPRLERACEQRLHQKTGLTERPRSGVSTS